MLDVQHPVVGGEDLLGPVAVMDVPVEDQHPLGAGRERVGGGDGDVVEQAEAHRAVASRRGGRAGAGRRTRTRPTPASRGTEQRAAAWAAPPAACSAAS